MPGRKPAEGCAQSARARPDSAGGIADACGPGSPDSHRVVWGLTCRPPVPPAGFPPVSRLPAGFSPFARRPLVSLRPAFSGSSPSAAARFRFPFQVSLRVSLPWAIVTIAPPRGGSGGVGPGRQGPRSPVPPPPPPRRDLAVIWSALHGWAAPGAIGCRCRIACCARPRAQDTAAPEPPGTAVSVLNRREAWPRSVTDPGIRTGSAARLGHWCRRGAARSHQSMVSASAVMRSRRPAMNST